MAQQVIELPWGRIEIDNNEVSIVSTVEDPPKIRMAAAAGLGLGALSWGRLRPDGKQEEMILLQGKQDERTRHDTSNLSGEVTLHVRNGAVENADQAMVKVAEIRHDGCWFLGGGAPTPVPTPIPEPDYIAKWGAEVRALYLYWLEREPDFDELRSDCENAEKYGIESVSENLAKRAGKA